MDDLVKRLQAYEGNTWETTACYNGLREEAAARIEALEAALRLAANRLEWCARGYPADSNCSVDTTGWAADARALTAPLHPTPSPDPAIQYTPSADPT